MRQFLKETFSARWFGRLGHMMATYITGFNTFRFFLMAVLKYATQPESLDDLRHRKECQQLYADTLSNLREAFPNRLYGSE